MNELEALKVIDLAAHGPWLVAAWLSYTLARRALWDLCETIPQVLHLGGRLADVAEKVAQDGITVRIERDEED